MVKVWLFDIVKRLHGFILLNLLPLFVYPPRKLYQGETCTVVRIAVMRFLEGWNNRIYGKVLDVGAGSWPYPRQLFESHCDYIATDYFDHPGIDIVSDIHHLTREFASESFDFVICTEVFEHIPYPWLAVKEIYAILKPGGTLLLSIPFNFHLHSKQDYWRITKLGLLVLLQEVAGFAQVDVSSVGHPDYPFSYHAVAYKGG